MPALYSLLAELNLPDRYPAILLLQEAISKDSGNAEAHSALAQLYMREQKWAEAQSHLEKALSLRANVSDYAYLADSLEKQNYPKAAAEVSRKALTMIEHV